MIPVCIPYDTSKEKNLGRAYNKMISHFRGSKFVVVMDYDAMFLTHDAIKHIEEYTKLFPETGIFTCYTNRLHPESKGQLLNGCVENDEIRFHIQRAEAQKKHLYNVTHIDHEIGGFLMVISLEAWSRVGGFAEDKRCLGVDNDFSRKILKAGHSIIRMDGIYVWHTYRLIHGHRDKKHLL